MKFRMLHLRPNRYKLLSSEDLMRTPADLAQVVQGAAITSISSTCEAVIDGGPFTLPLWAIDKSEISAVEVYVRPGPRGGATSINPGGTAPASAQGGCKVNVYIWLKP
jgi:hypothetical protein